MDKNIIDAATQNFNLPHDMVELPTRGVFYKTKKKSIKVGYLTANDENLLNNANRKSGEDLMLSLLRSKIYEHDIKPEELMDADIQAILIFLRNTSFGPEYTVQLEDPQTKKSFSTTVLLDELNYKKTEHKPDDSGHFLVKLPKSGVTVKLKPLSFGENIEINKMGEQYPAGMVAPVVTWKLNKQIVEISGDSSKENISTFVSQLPIYDSKFIKNFLRDNTPSLDLEKTVIAPSGEMVTFDVALGVEFFRPFF